MNFNNNIKLQKLILKCEDDSAFVFFYDENQELHEYDFSDGSFVNLWQLVVSCFEPIEDDGIDGVLTCSCGWSSCAGFHCFISEVADNNIYWKVNNSDLFRFEKTQYIEEIKKTLCNLMKICDNKDYLDYFIDEKLSRKDLNKLKSPFDNYDILSKIAFPKHKITIFPEENYIYLNENNEKIGIKDEELGFFWTDIFGESCEVRLYLDGIKNWTEELNDIESINWYDWNLKGIEYAQKIRNFLSGVFDVWYRFRGEEKEDIRILKIKR